MAVADSGHDAVLLEIESLRRASLAGLREKYREVLEEETQCRHREHLFRRIAWRLQALAEGNLSERARSRAHQIASGNEKDGFQYGCAKAIELKKYLA